MKTVRNTLLGLALLVGGLQASDQAERKVVPHQDPDYPAMAKKMNLHGTVKIKVWIAPDGSVRRVEYLGGHPLLAESALNAVKSWKYERAPNESTAIVEVKF